MQTRLYYRLANEILFGNLIANFIGNLATDVIFSLHMTEIDDRVISRLEEIDFLYICFSIPTCICLILLYEKPIRACLKLILDNKTPDPDMLSTAQRRLLNEPYVIVTLNAILWGLGSIVFWIAELPGAPYIGIACGLVTIILSFFWVEHVSQHNLMKYFFPKGGLSTVEGAKPIRISTRLFSLLFAGTFIPLFFIHVTIIKAINLSDSSNISLRDLLSEVQKTIAMESLIFGGLAIFITFLVLQNLKQPIKEIIRVLTHVRKGNLTERASIYSNDEIGFTGDVVNAMTEELLEKEKMSHSLDLAKEVQQSLLPQEDFYSDSIDITGTSIYCDQTGGDGFDIFHSDKADSNSISAVISDVSGHGISSALLMASARSSLRLRKSMPGSLGDIVTDVNCQLCEDFSSSGQFISMFFLAICIDEDRLEWVRAGHDPALLYDPETDQFTELIGKGIVLGVNDSHHYRTEHLNGIRPGQVIVLFTDGIWETHNSDGEKFGKNRLKEVIRNTAEKGTDHIVSSILDTVEIFRGELEPEDDMTLVVIKIRNS